MIKKKNLNRVRGEEARNSLDERKTFIGPQESKSPLIVSSHPYGVNAQPIAKPYGKNSVPLLSVLFEDREYYKNFIIPEISKFFPEKAIFADLTEKNSLFGLINNDLNVILPNAVFMKQVPSGDEQTRYAMDFVADAFEEMAGYLNTAVFLGKLYKSSPYANLKSHRSYFNPEYQLTNTKNAIITEFKKKLINDPEFSAKVKDPKTFNKKFLEVISDLIKAKGFSVTKSAIVLNSNFNNFSSGLIIDIAKDKADDDKLKFDKYLSKDDFLIFAEACKRFGFLIDANVPWRIVADLNSPAMLEKTGTHEGYMLRYNLSSSTDLFSKRFSSVYLDELFYLQDFFYQAYSSLIRDYPYYEIDYKEIDKCDFNKSIIKERPNLTKEEYTSLFSPSYWLRMHVYLRNYEENKKLTQTEFENIVREASNFLNVGRAENALAFVNNYFKEFKDVAYFSSLQSQNKAVELNVQSGNVPQLVF